MLIKEMEFREFKNKINKFPVFSSSHISNFAGNKQTLINKGDLKFLTQKIVFGIISLDRRINITSLSLKKRGEETIMLLGKLNRKTSLFLFGISLVLVLLIITLLLHNKKRPFAFIAEEQKESSLVLKAYEDIMLWTRSHSSDFKEICQHTLDLDWLQNFYHIDVPGRKPLIVLKNKFFNEPPSLSKFGEPVVFLSEAEIKEKKIEAYFIFSEILPSSTNDEAIITFKYPVEGVFGRVHFRKDNSGWKIIRQEGGET